MFPKNHVSQTERLQIGLWISENSGHYGVVTQTAQSYGVSRWFIYWCQQQVAGLLMWWEIWSSGSSPTLAQVQSLEEIIVSLSLETKASLSGIRQSLASVFGVSVSVGSLSETLQELGGRLPKEPPLPEGSWSFVPDELFARGLPLLVTVEPISGAILQLCLAEKRDAVTWGENWQSLSGNHAERVKKVVADQGSGIIAGIAQSLPHAVYQPDHWHLLNPLKQRLRVLERQAYAAIQREYKSLTQWEKSARKTTAVERRQTYEQSCQTCEQAMARYEAAAYLLKLLQHELTLINPQSGQLRSHRQVASQTQVLVTLMQDLDDPLWQHRVELFAKHLPQALTYLQEVATLETTLRQRVGDDTRYSALLLHYHYQHLSFWVPKAAQKKVRQEWAFWQEALREELGEVEYERLTSLVAEHLDGVLRSSSMVETTNSRLRPFLNAARGQITQERLNLIRFYLNHRPFERGRRAGQTAAQLWEGKTGTPPHWLVRLC